MPNNYIKPEQWLEAGYRKYTGYNPRSADYFFQKKFKDDMGVKYFIECYVYDYNKPEWSSAAGFGKVGYQLEMYTVVNGNVVYVTISPKDEADSIEELEQWFEQMWIATGSNYSEKYDDAR